MKNFIPIFVLVYFLGCEVKKDHHKICIPYNTELDISLGENVLSIKEKFKLLEKAYFNSGDTLVYIDFDRFEINGRNIRSTIYFYFYKKQLTKINSLYEVEKNDTSSFKWLKKEVMKCSKLQEKKKNIWEYDDKTVSIELSVSFDKLNDSLQRCWYLIEQRGNGITSN